MLEFKSDVIINAPIDKVIALYEDSAKLPAWYYQCTKMELVEDINENEKIFYFVIHLPFPVAERDSVFRRIKSVDSATGIVTYEITAMPDRLPKVKGKIRVPSVKTIWHFKPLDDGKTEVYFQQRSDPGGSIPAFLANSLVLDIPFQSLKNLRQLIEG
jgi:hypothetical protein